MPKMRTFSLLLIFFAPLNAAPLQRGKITRCGLEEQNSVRDYGKTPCTIESGSVSIKFTLRCCGEFKPELGREYDYEVRKDQIRIQDGKKPHRFWILSV